MQSVDTLPVVKTDFKDVEGYLKRHNLVDDRGIWFGGFDDSQRGEQNAIARNAMYGNKHLMILTVKDDTIYVLKNGKQGFHVSHVGSVQDSYRIRIHRGILYPSIELHASNEISIYLQSNKNKGMMKEFKKLLK